MIRPDPCGGHKKNPESFTCWKIRDFFIVLLKRYPKLLGHADKLAPAAVAEDHSLAQEATVILVDADNQNDKQEQKKEEPQ